MVKNHLDNEKGNLLLKLYELFFLINSKGYFICTRIVHINFGLVLTLTRNRSLGPPGRIDPTTHHITNRHSTTELLPVSNREKA